MRNQTSKLGFAALLVCATAAFAQGQQVPAPGALPFTLKPLGHDVWAAIAVPGSKAGSNSGFAIGDDGVSVIDTFQDAGAARALLGEIRNITKLPVKFVINTHYHIDHVTGNGVFAEAGAIIFAQRNVRDWIHTENLKFFGAAITPAQKALVEGFVSPDAVYDDGVDLYLGSRRVKVRVYPGHTGGDSVVFIPDANVVFTGDLFWRHSLPNTIDASTAPLMKTLATLTAENPSAQFVPGHGDVGSAQDVDAFRGYIGALREAVSAAQAQGKTGDALVEAVVPALKEKYGEWGIFERFAPRNVRDTDAELRGTKRIPNPAEHN